MSEITRDERALQLRALAKTPEGRKELAALHAKLPSQVTREAAVRSGPIYSQIIDDILRGEFPGAR